MTEGVTVTRMNALGNPALRALIEELTETAHRNLAAGIPLAEVLSCFITTMRTSAFFAGRSSEDFSALLLQVIEGNADWWQRVALDVGQTQGEG